MKQTTAGVKSQTSNIARTSIALSLALAISFGPAALLPTLAAPAKAAPHTVPGVDGKELNKLGIEYIETKPVAGTLQTVSEYRLKKNGLTILLSQRHVTPIATVMVVYHVGSRNEAVGYTGSTHFLEHMMFKGTSKHDPLKGTGIDDTLKPIGGYNNATTSFDRTNYFEIVPSKEIGICLDMEADRMRHLLLRKSDHDAEMTVVRNELERGEDEPEEILQQNLFSTAFKEHPYHHPVIGWRSDVENVPITRLRQFYEEFYYPNNATLIVIGDFQMLPQLKAIANNFSNIPRSPKPFPSVYTQEPAQEGERRFLVQRGAELPRVAMAYRGVSVRDKDYYPLDVIDSILGDESKKSSRLYKALVDTGLASEVSAYNTALRDPGIYMVSATATPQTKPQQLEQVLKAQIEELKKVPVSQSELARAKQSVLKRVKLAASDPVGLAEHLAESISGDTWQFLSLYPERIKAVTTADIQRVANKYFNNKSITVGYYLPKDGAADQPMAKGAEPTATSQAKTGGAETGSAATVTANLATSKEKDATALTTDSNAAGTEKPAAKDYAPPSTVSQVADQEQKSQAATTNATPIGTPEQASPIAAGAKPAQPVEQPIAGSPTGNPGQHSKGAKLEVQKVGNGRFSANVKKFVLENGMTLLVMPIKGTGTVAVSGRVRAGEYFREPKKTLVPDFLADQLTAGTISMSKETLAQKLEMMGTTLSFNDDDFWLSFNSEVTSEDLNTFLPLLADTLQHPAFSETELSKSKKVKLASIKDQMVDTGSVSLNNFTEAWYKPDSVYYNRPFEEQVTEVPTITVADLQQFHQHHVVPANTVLTIVGDVTAEQALASVEGAFANWSGSAKEKISISDELIVKTPARKIVKSELADKANIDVEVGRPVKTSVGSPEYFPLLIGNSALGYDSFACRLAPIRDKYGLTYGISSSFSGEFPYAPWMIAFSVNPPNYKRANELVHQIVHDYLKSGITPAELAKEKSHLDGAFYVGLLSPKRIASKLCELEILGPGAKFMDDYSDNLRHVTLAQVNDAIREYFQLDQAVTSACGTFKK